ncbi:MAG: helix-turn-helix domain-containing protein [Planctomycetota bacterium]|jgi:excisionase family DNA binding protein
MATSDTSHLSKESADHPKQWYTIQGAARYLGVSQPTIFRWMKEGSLSFFKIGGATRFSQEGLEAVIEKTTGQKEAELVAGRCAACGHSVLVEGYLRGAGKLYFRPAKSAFWVLEEAMVPTRARVCAACGYLQLHADIAKLKRLKPKTVEDNDPEPEDVEPGETTE